METLSFCGKSWSCVTNKYIYIGLSPLPVTVTTRVVMFLVGDPYKPSFATVTGRGDNPNYIHVKKYIISTTIIKNTLMLFHAYQTSIFLSPPIRIGCVCHVPIVEIPTFPRSRLHRAHRIASLDQRLRQPGDPNQWGNRESFCHPGERWCW